MKRLLALFLAALIAGAPSASIAQRGTQAVQGAQSDSVLNAAPRYRVVSHFTFNNDLGFAPTKGNGASVITTLGVGLTPTIVDNGSTHGSTCTSGAGKVLTGTTGMGTLFTATVTVTAGVVTSVTGFTAGAYVVPPTSLTSEPVTGDSCTGVILGIADGTAGMALNTPSVGYYGATAVSLAAGGASCNGASSQYFQDASAVTGTNSPAKFRATVSAGALSSPTIAYAGRYAPGAFPASLSALPIIGRACVGSTFNLTLGVTTPTGAGGSDYAGTPTLNIARGSGDSSGTGASGTVTLTGNAVSSISGWSGGAGWVKLPTITIIGTVASGGYLVTDQGELGAHPDTAPTGGFSAPRITLCNWGLGTADAAHVGFQEQVPANPITVAAWIEPVTATSPAVGKLAPFPFKDGHVIYGAQGQTTWQVTIQPGACVQSEPAGSGYIAGGTIYRTWTSLIAGGSGPLYQWPKGGLGETTRPNMGWVSSATPSAISYPSELALNSPNTNMHYAPLMLSAITTTPAALIIGDSVFNGFKDLSATDYGGSFARALGYSYGWLKVTRSSDKVVNWVSYGSGSVYPAFNVGQAAMRQAIDLSLFDVAFTELGSNDLNVASGSYAAVQTNLQAFWQWLTSNKLDVYPVTMIPRAASSTDNFTTLAGQTAGTGWLSNGGYLQYNAYVRGCPIANYCKGFVEYGNLLASSSDSGFWITSSASPPNPLIYTFEGTHPLEQAASTWTGVTAAVVNAAGSGGGAGTCIFLGGTGTPTNPGGTAANFQASAALSAGGLNGTITILSTGAYTANPTATGGAVTGTGGCAALSGATVNVTTANNPASVGYTWPVTGGPFAADATLPNLTTRLSAIMAQY